MKEIEVKFPVKNHREVRSLIKDTGARLVWEGVDESWFFDTPKGALKRKHQILRLRRQGSHSITLTIKSPPRGKKDVRFKVRHEYEIELENLKDAMCMLDILSYYEWFHYKKYREHWIWNAAHVKVELDRLRDGRRFVEIEGPKNGIRAAASVLGLDWKQATIKSYVSLLQTDKV